MIDPGRLFALCDDILTAVVTYYAAEGVTLPSRQYIAPGDQLIAHDCEQVTVGHQGTAASTGRVLQVEGSGSLSAPAHSMRAATVAVEVVRCGPSIPENGSAPLPASEETVAALIYADTQLIWNALLTAQRAGDLGGCGSLAFIDATTPGVQGGYVSAKVRVVLGLE